MLQITQKTSPEEISEHIKSLREQKGREKEVLAVINKALGYGHDFVINLFWEEALTYQHMLMNDPGNKGAIIKMEGAVLMAKFYIEKYNLIRWKSRLFRFLGRISDYKGEFTMSVGFYKKAILLSNLDPEPFRDLELRGFLSDALIMSGKVDLGYKMAKKTFSDFELSENGKNLKKKNYQAWVIWRSGIVIRTINVFITKKLNFDKKEALEWLKTVEDELKNGDFSYRKAEVGALNQKLQRN